MSVEPLEFGPAVESELPAIMRLLADDPLGATREVVTDPLDPAHADERGCRMIQLNSDKARPKAIALYESLGSRATHEGPKLHRS